MSANDPLPVALGLPREARCLPLLFPKRPDEPDGPQSLRDGRRDLPALLRPRPRMTPEPAEKHLESKHEDRYERKREQGEAQ